MKIPSAEQIREADAYTIRHEPVSSVDLMERAALQCTRWLCSRYPVPTPFVVYCGPGNNGGDGLAIARQLQDQGYPVRVVLLTSPDRFSPDGAVNLSRWTGAGGTWDPWNQRKIFPVPPHAVVVDALFGTGLSRPLSGDAAAITEHINSHPGHIIAIDMPSGLSDDGSTIPDTAVRATCTLSFEFPKRAFFFPHLAPFTGRWFVLPIGLHEDMHRQIHSPYHWLTPDRIAPLIHPRDRFAHKNQFGHALLVAGSLGKAGAAVLACKGFMRAGGGLLTLHAPSEVCAIQQSTVPEGMCQYDRHPHRITDVPLGRTFGALGIGPGMGTHPETAEAMKHLLEVWKGPLVLDADALNLLAAAPEMQRMLTEQTILTPHPGEFDRLAGTSANPWERHLKQRALAEKLRVIIVLKGGYSGIALPGGDYFFNTNGNPGMATAGSGDVLTGIILSLLAQKYAAEDAALTGVFLHGMAGDLAASELGQEALMASDIAAFLGKSFLTFNSKS
jgi:NAD(P)H-hydrate epimerase